MSTIIIVLEYNISASIYERTNRLLVEQNVTLEWLFLKVIFVVPFVNFRCC